MTHRPATDPHGASVAGSDPATRTLLTSAVRLAGLRCWTWNLATGELSLSAEAQEIFGEGSLDGSFASWLRFVDSAHGRRPRERF